MIFTVCEVIFFRSKIGPLSHNYDIMIYYVSLLSWRVAGFFHQQWDDIHWLINGYKWIEVGFPFLRGWIFFSGQIWTICFYTSKSASHHQIGMTTLW